MVSEQDLYSSIKYLQMSKGRVYSITQILFSSSSKNHDTDDKLKCPLIIDFPELYRYFSIKEFLDWLVNAERLFEYETISEGKQVKFVARKLKTSV